MKENETYQLEPVDASQHGLNPDALKRARQDMCRLRAEMDDIRRTTPYVRFSIPVLFHFHGTLDAVLEAVRRFEFPDDLPPEWEFIDDHSQGALTL